jgi:histone deacetylase complex regulatory component SIN3
VPTSLLQQQQPSANLLSTSSGAPAPQISSVPAIPPDVLFFTRVKKAFEGQPQAYEDLLKLLDLYTKEIVPARVLMARMMEMLGDTHAELFLQFKALLGTEAGTDPEKGPPGSIRTGPPDSLSLVQPTDDGQGPSYRHLPDSVSFKNYQLSHFSPNNAILVFFFNLFINDVTRRSSSPVQGVMNSAARS